MTRTETRALWFCGGVLSAIWQMMTHADIGFGRGYEMLNAARTLVAKGYYGDPFLVLATGPTAMVPPAYPFIVSLFGRVFGFESGMWWSVTAFCLAAHGLYVMLLPELGERLLGWRTAGSFAAAVAVLVPAFPLMPQWDTMLTTVALLAYLLLPANALLLGAWSGLLALLNPIAVPMAFLRILWPKPRLVFTGIWVAGFLLTSGPWMVRNRAVLGTWNLRTNFGTTLMVSNNDSARPDLRSSIDTGGYNSLHPNRDMAEARLIMALGEAAYDAKRTSDGFEWMRRNPKRTFELTLARFRDFWFPPPGGPFHRGLGVWLLTGLGMAGLAWMAKARAPMWGYLAAVILITPMPYYIVVSELRYRAPVLWVSQLAAGYLLARLMERYGRRAESWGGRGAD